MKTPAVSIVVPVYNEAQNLEKLHSALKNLDFADEYEILYIDDGSTDESWKILQNFSKEPRVRCIKLDKNYPVGYARAFGVEKTKGDIIACMDADCIPTPNWLNMVRYLDGKTAVVGFPVIPPAELDYLAQRFEYIGDGKPDPKVYLHGSGVLMRKDVVLKVGNYPAQSVGEDTVLFRKISEAGYELKYTREAKIYHNHRQQNFIAFLRRFFRAGENNTSIRTFLIFDLLFPLVLFLSFMMIYYVGTYALFSLIFPVGFLANPATILFYTRNFAKPENKIARLAVFTAMKIAVSLAFILGVWKATRYKVIS